MRVIAGSARSLTLKTIDSLDTRPTTDRIKETLFNMIQFSVPGTEFLDLFAGSGGIGIEALSRGARRAVFADNNKKAVSVIEENIRHAKFEDRSYVIAGDYMSVINQLRSRDYHFGIVFLDPPYNKGLERKAMMLMREQSFVDENTIFIVEADLHDDLSDIESYGYEITREKNYKTNKHVFFKEK